MSDVDDLERLAEMKARGVLSEDEFQSAKAKIIGGIKKPLVIPPPAASPSKPMGWLAKTSIVVVVLIVAFFAYGAIKLNSPEGQAKAKDRAAIDLCWQDYERKNLDAAQKKFVADTCYRMQGDFRARYGVGY